MGQTRKEAKEVRFLSDSVMVVIANATICGIEDSGLPITLMALCW